MIAANGIGVGEGGTGVGDGSGETIASVVMVAVMAEVAIGVVLVHAVNETIDRPMTNKMSFCRLMLIEQIIPVNHIQPASTECSH